MENLFQSTRPSRGATVKFRQHRRVAVKISIHAPLAGRDLSSPPEPPRVGDFNPRAPRGARLFHGHRQAAATRFQSTRPSRGATANVHKNHVHICANTQKKYVFLSNTVCQSA